MVKPSAIQSSVHRLLWSDRYLLCLWQDKGKKLPVRCLETLIAIWHHYENQVGDQQTVSLNRPVRMLSHLIASCMSLETSASLGLQRVGIKPKFLPTESSRSAATKQMARDEHVSQDYIFLPKHLNIVIVIFLHHSSLDRGWVGETWRVFKPFPKLLVLEGKNLRERTRADSRTLRTMQPASVLPGTKLRSPMLFWSCLSFPVAHAQTLSPWQGITSPELMIWFSWEQLFHKHSLGFPYSIICWCWVCSVKQRTGI